MRILQTVIDSQRYLSKRFDSLLVEKYRIAGRYDFAASFLPHYLQPGLKVYDVGAGKNPLVSTAIKKELNLNITGIDIDQKELDLAPPGSYDEVICADITEFKGEGDGDLVICCTLLEHVKDVERAFESISTLLKEGGKAIIFVPSRNAVFARLNLLLPEKLKNHLLDIYDRQRRELRGFPSYYDKCTPRDFKKIAHKYGLQLENQRLYFISGYFSIFFPLYVLWRFWVFLFHALADEQAAETFSIAFKKTSMLQ